MSLRELPLPPRTKAKRKEKMGQSVWADPTTAFGRARKVITEDKLKALSSVLLHKLVSFHIHKMLQALRESLHLTTDYLTTKEKVVMAMSKAKAVEAKYSTLRK